MYKQIKNIEAPLAWEIWKILKNELSVIIFITLKKANEEWGIKVIEINNPVIICNIKHIPNNDPKFQ